MTTATFSCQPFIIADISIAWKVNGTSLGLYNPPNITTKSNTLPDGRNIDKLMITALPEYNATTIECVIVHFDGSHPQSSPPVNLLIQGLFYLIHTRLQVFYEELRLSAELI